MENTIHKRFKDSAKAVILMLIIMLSTIFSAVSQVKGLADTANFYDYMNAFYNSKLYDSDDKTEGGLKVAHERLNRMWGSRLYPHGDF